MGDVRETFEEVERRTTKLESRQDQLKGQVAKTYDVNMDAMQWVLNTTVGELIEKDDILEAMMTTLNEQKGELAICKATLGNRMLAMAPKLKVDVPKSKEFNGTKVTKDVNNFLWRMEQYFRAKGIVDDDTKVNIVTMYFIDGALL